MIATQDRELQEKLRKKPGQPLMYLHKKTPVLEQPSELSRKTVEFKLNEAFKFGTADEKKLSKCQHTAPLVFMSTDLSFWWHFQPTLIKSNHNFCPFCTATIKKSEGLPVAEAKEPSLKKKKKKQPNPLSCKKKKKKAIPTATAKPTTIESIKDKTIDKTKRKRVRLPTHIKQMLTETTTGTF